MQNETEWMETDARTGGKKGQKIERYDLIPTQPLRQLARHYGAGAQKYADRNWELGYDWSLSYAAAQRHLNAFWGGDTIDEEGNLHLAAAAFHIFALMEFCWTHLEGDNRPKPKPSFSYSLAERKAATITSQSIHEAQLKDTCDWIVGKIIDGTSNLEDEPAILKDGE